MQHTTRVSHLQRSVHRTRPASERRIRHDRQRFTPLWFENPGPAQLPRATSRTRRPRMHRTPTKPGSRRLTITQTSRTPKSARSLGPRGNQPQFRVSCSSCTEPKTRDSIVPRDRTANIDQRTDLPTSPGQAERISRCPNPARSSSLQTDSLCSAWEIASSKMPVGW